MWSVQKKTHHKGTKEVQSSQRDGFVNFVQASDFVLKLFYGTKEKSAGTPVRFKSQPRNSNHRGTENTARKISSSALLLCSVSLWLVL